MKVKIGMTVLAVIFVLTNSSCEYTGTRINDKVIIKVGIAKTCFDVFNILAVLLMVDNCFMYLIISSRAAKAIR